MQSESETKDNNLPIYAKFAGMKLLFLPLKCTAKENCESAIDYYFNCLSIIYFF